MGVRSDLGRRVELVSMDPWFHDISVGLYRQDRIDGPVGIVHSYSCVAGVGDRLQFIAHALCTLGGFELDDSNEHVARSSCGHWHNAATKRLFLDCFRLDPELPIQPLPLQAPDTRSDQVITVVPLGGGEYRVDSTGEQGDEPPRAPAVARALCRLVELDAVDDTTVRFSCGSSHDTLMGLMLVRAQNLRAALREEELSASRGVLSAPSAQE